MSDNRITQAEMVELFGDEMPIEAVELMSANHPPDTPLHYIRDQLRQIADKRSQEKRENLARIIENWECDLVLLSGVAEDDPICVFDDASRRIIAIALRHYGPAMKDSAPGGSRQEPR